MTFECRNGVKTGANRYAMVLDVSSTSSDDEDVRMLRELKGFYLFFGNILISENGANSL